MFQDRFLSCLFDLPVVIIFCLEFRGEISTVLRHVMATTQCNQFVIDTKMTSWADVILYSIFNTYFSASAEFGNNPPHAGALRLSFLTSLKSYHIYIYSTKPQNPSLYFFACSNYSFLVCSLQLAVSLWCACTQEFGLLSAWHKGLCSHDPFMTLAARNHVNCHMPHSVI